MHQIRLCIGKVKVSEVALFIIILLIRYNHYYYTINKYSIYIKKKHDQVVSQLDLVHNLKHISKTHNTICYACLYAVCLNSQDQSAYYLVGMKRIMLCCATAQSMEPFAHGQAATLNTKFLTCECKNAGTCTLTSVFFRLVYT